MNILYVSNLTGWLSEGPTYSVPAQIEAQSKFDSVFWYNLNVCNNVEWRGKSYYHDLEDFPSGRISMLPKPFNSPDFVVVEQFYNLAKTKIPYELYFGHLPYILIPRGELTKGAQGIKGLKKTIANTLFFKWYAKKARTIQYLTNEELVNSVKWNKNHIVFPNGVYPPREKKAVFHSKEIKCISIGRIDIMHKGLDLLLEACNETQNELRNNKCSIVVYGPDKIGDLAHINSVIINNGIEDIVSFNDPIYGEAKKAKILEADVFIMTSRFEGHPTALIEALSYGLPCVATTGSNMRNKIEAANAGWTADNTVESIKKALLAMIADKNRFLEKSMNACILANEYDWITIAERTHERYEKLLREKNE